MDRVKLMCYVLIIVQFLFFAWILSSMAVDGRFTDLIFNGDTLTFEIVLAGAIILGAIYLRLRRLKEIIKPSMDG